MPTERQVDAGDRSSAEPTTSGAEASATSGAGATGDSGAEESGNSSEAESDTTDASESVPSDAFQALGNETRVTILRALAAESPQSFSALFDATDEDVSAGFAYHLRQLDGRFLRQRADERYELTDAGREVARAVQAGTFTQSAYWDRVEVCDDCPFCGTEALVATVSDNVTEIACESCERPVLGLPFPPSGYDDRAAEELPEAIDAHHRRRIESFGDGVCPECAGSVHASIEAVDSGSGAVNSSSETVDTGSEAARDVDGHVLVQAVFDCETCTGSLRCPVSLTVLDHPAVVAFYHDHGVDVRDRPIWNVGREWRERVVSRDPWCVIVSTRLDGEDLLLYVAGDGTVVDHRRAGPDDDEPAEQGEPAESAEGTDGSVQTPEDEPAERLNPSDEATA